VERVTHLIRSKGVGVYYVTQSPADIPDRISAQLGNRVHHAMRAFTPREQKAIRAASQTMRANPDIDAEQALRELQVGEALVSFLNGNATKIPVVPVLLGDTAVLRSVDLPESARPLLDLQAVRLQRGPKFEDDVKKLLVDAARSIALAQDARRTSLEDEDQSRLL
jgi:uncharacterized protein